MTNFKERLQNLVDELNKEYELQQQEKLVEIDKKLKELSDWLLSLGVSFRVKFPSYVEEFPLQCFSVSVDIEDCHIKFFSNARLFWHKSISRYGWVSQDSFFWQLDENNKVKANSFEDLENQLLNKLAKAKHEKALSDAMFDEIVQDTKKRCPNYLLESSKNIRNK